MKKKLFRIVALIIMLGTIASTTANAAPISASEYISSYAAVTTKSGTKLTVTYSVDGNTLMTSIGASKITIYEKNGSAAWKVVKTFSYPATTGLRSSNAASHYSSVTYTGVAGRQYYAVVEFYAGNSTGSDTKTSSTNTVTL